MQTVLFDLDGTLTDPKLGITRCIQHALGMLGESVPDADALEWCIGPPLHQSFARILNTDSSSRIGEAMGHYRARFRETGMFENSLYPAIPGVLGALRASDLRLFVATSKPWVFARPIIEHFGLGDYFEAVHGAELDGTRADKSALIEFILDRHGLCADETVMVGDRSHDIAGARSRGVPSIGVTYGYGGRDELERAGAHFVVDSPTELIALIAG